jgi:hypothetical protein
MTSPPSLQKRQRPNLKSGLHTLRKAVAVLGNRALPSSRTALGRELQAWRNGLVDDLGGEDQISTQRLALVDLAVRTKLQVDSVDAYLLGLPSLVDKRHRRMWPVVKERQSLVNQLQSILRDLGLERRVRDAGDLAAQLAALHRQTQDEATLAPPSREEKGEKGGKGTAATEPPADAALPVPALELRDGGRDGRVALQGGRDEHGPEPDHDPE